jgi:hypothetical protein
MVQAALTPRRTSGALLPLFLLMCGSVRIPLEQVDAGGGPESLRGSQQPKDLVQLRLELPTGCLEELGGKRPGPAARRLGADLAEDSLEVRLPLKPPGVQLLDSGGFGFQQQVKGRAILWDLAEVNQVEVSERVVEV